MGLFIGQHFERKICCMISHAFDSPRFRVEHGVEAENIRRQFWRNFALSAEEAKLRYTRLRWTMLPLEFKGGGETILGKHSLPRNNVLYKLRRANIFETHTPYA